MIDVPFWQCPESTGIRPVPAGVKRIEVGFAREQTTNIMFNSKVPPTADPLLRQQYPEESDRRYYPPIWHKVTAAVWLIRNQRITARSEGSPLAMPCEKEIQPVSLIFTAGEQKTTGETINQKLPARQRHIVGSFCD